ncbi:MAG: DUF420 domain-containing protein [Acidobacteria bacterium]|nr:DUF420 domain-containing protein [Acidobacteriota bacterium]MDW7984073.1 DUF420 domain-containing protein [Acidobacteriota bacterium]
MDGEWRVWWPAFHAVLNGTTAVLLAAGRYFIHRRQVRAHRRCMHAAFGLSVLFFASYLVYHSLVGTTRFGHGGWLRVAYLTVLTTHTVLAVAVVPLAVMVLVWGLRRQWSPHRALARWAWPIWLYVVVTGVVIYFMLYRF